MYLGKWILKVKGAYIDLTNFLQEKEKRNYGIST